MVSFKGIGRKKRLDKETINAILRETGESHQQDQQEGQGKKRTNKN